MDSIKVSSIANDQAFDLRLELLAGGAGLDRRLVSARIQKPGLALAGFFEHIHKDRLQVFGTPRSAFWPRCRPRCSSSGCARSSTCHLLLVVTKNLGVPDWMKKEADAAKVPL